MDGEPRTGNRRWPSLIPIGGCAAFSASTLSIYVRDVAAEIACAGSLVCGDFRADPRALAAGAGFAILALGRLLGTAFEAKGAGARGRARGWPAPLLTAGVGSRFAGLTTVAILNNAGAGVFSVIPLAIGAFLGIGFAVLWRVTALPASFGGGWGLPARGAARVHGAISLAATLVTLRTALGPGPPFM